MAQLKCQTTVLLMMLDTSCVELCDLGLLYERRREGFEGTTGVLMHPVLQSFGCGCVFLDELVKNSTLPRRATCVAC